MPHLLGRPTLAAIATTALPTMHVAAALFFAVPVLAQSSGSGAQAQSPAPSSASSQASLQKSVTNDYFTPKKTYTPATTFETAQQGHPTSIVGVGPSGMPNSYTWVYTVPDSTVPGPLNQTLSSVLAAQGHTSGASNLQPAPGALQVCKVSLTIDGTWLRQWCHSPRANCELGILASGRPVGTLKPYVFIFLPYFCAHTPMKRSVANPDSATAAPSRALMQLPK